MAIPRTERSAVRQTIRALIADGWILSSVDGESVRTESAALAEIEAVGFAHLYVFKGESQGFVFFTMQDGDPTEVVCDYTTNLTCVESLTDGWY